MIAAAILSIGILGMIQTFQFITMSVQSQKGRTLGNNLAQEKIEILKNLSYYRLLLTTAPYLDNRFNPNIQYDGSGGFYPYEDITVSGINFRRGVEVDFAGVVGGTISTMTFNSLDPGLKQITVYVIWADRGQYRYLTLTNLLENPNVNPLDASIAGTVTKSGGGNLAGALVKVLENTNWQAYTNSAGAYSFSVYHGSYTVQASSDGYYAQVSGLTSVPRGTDQTVNFSLSPISTGTFFGTAWSNDHLVITQVVASTVDPVGNTDQYVELFNPTTFTWTMANALNSGVIGLKYQRQSTKYDIPLDYNTLTLGPSSYYLIANTGTVVVGGVSKDADAQFDNSGTNYPTPFYVGSSGALGLYWLSQGINGTTIDAVGWNHNGVGVQAQFYEKTPIQSWGGIGANEQFVRLASTAGATSPGRCYDSSTNNVDYADNTPITVAPNNSDDSAACAGETPLNGALVSADDGLSASTQAYLTGSPPVAQFNLTVVATGTWNVSVASGGWLTSIASATIPSAGARVGILNANTSPAWSSAGSYSVVMTSTNVNGFVSGHVRDIFGVGLGGMKVRAAGNTATTASDGFYFVTASSGDVFVTANPNNQNPSYTSQEVELTIPLGGIITQDFYMSLGGTVTGYITSGPSPLPNIVVTADLGGSQCGSGVSDTTGHVYIYHLSTGTFNVLPALDPASASTPAVSSATVTVGAAVNVGTFTIVGAFGTLKGNVTLSGNPITTGVMILASTATIPSVPPVIVASSAAAQQVYYMAASLSDGSYSLLVRGSTYYNYSAAAYYPTVNSAGSVTISTRTITGISVTPSGSTTQNFSF